MKKRVMKWVAQFFRWLETIPQAPLPSSLKFQTCPLCRGACIVFHGDTHDTFEVPCPCCNGKGEVAKP